MVTQVPKLHTTIDFLSAATPLKRTPDHTKTYIKLSRFIVQLTPGLDRCLSYAMAIERCYNSFPRFHSIFLKREVSNITLLCLQSGHTIAVLTGCSRGLFRNLLNGKQFPWNKLCYLANDKFAYLKYRLVSVLPNFTMKTIFLKFTNLPEFNLATWFRMVNIMELNIEKYLILNELFNAIIETILKIQ